MNTPVKARAVPRTSGYPLISKERMQKLDLLKHLIANLANVSVVCGPDGIGKSRLLKIFQDEAVQPVIVSWLKADSRIHFDQIKECLSNTIAETVPDLKAQPLSVALDRINSRGGTLVQIIDDAGFLLPGLIGKAIEYANMHPALRLVLALSHNELYIKSGTDPALEDCYQIEIPPLSQQQCEDYLEYLSTLPNPRIDFSDINEERVVQVFSETHGIPGKILEILPQPVVKKTIDYSNPILLSAVAALVLVVVGVQWWSAHHVEESKKLPVAINQDTSPLNKSESIGMGAVAPSPSPSLAADLPIAEQPEKPSAGNPVETTPVTTASTPANTYAENKQSSLTQESQSLANDQVPKANKSPADQSAQVNLPTTGAPTDISANWVNAQPSENLTMQLMALSNEQDILGVIDRHPELKTDLRYIRTKTRRGGERFILFYGSFADPELLKVQRQTLPKELKQVWIRKMADLQKQLNSAPESPTQAD